MKGILNEQVQQAPGDEVEAPADEGLDPAQTGTESAEASDEDVERVVLAAQEVLYDERTHKSIVSMLGAMADEPAKALAKVTTDLLVQLDEEAGGEIPDDAILPAAIQILPEISELAQKSGVFEVNDEVMGQAVGEMFLLMEQQGWVTEEDKAEIQQILAEQEGAQAQGA